MDQFMALNMSFNIDKDDYKMLIKKLRKRLPQSTKHGYRVVKPLLGPLSWLDIELIAEYHRITLRLDRRTLYVRGYCRNDDTHFWEFYDDDSPLIPGSRSLGYSGSYAGGFSIASVVPEHIPLEYHPLLGLTGTACMERHNLLLGYQALRGAIISLAVKQDPSIDRQTSAASLLIMIQMITEAARIEKIGEHIIQNWSNPKPTTPRMVELENVWGTPYSGAVTLGSRASTLVSIEYVRLESINSEGPVELYGTVMVKDWKGSHAVYERSLDSAESKGPGDYISLTGPSTAVFGADPFTISVSLWDHDNQIAEGVIVWDPQVISWDLHPLSSYDLPRVKDVAGECGSVSVQYSVVRFALSTTVSIVLINDDRESSTNVYGTIKAMIASPRYESWRTLFDKSEDEYVQVPHSECQCIPLPRPVFVAPVHSYLTIQADLRDRDILPPYNLIARGSVQFTPAYGTLPMKTITGRCGEVKVFITCD